MNLNLPNQIYGENNKFDIDESKNTHIFIGANGSGKTLLMAEIVKTIGNNKVKVIAQNVNQIENIQAIDETQTVNDSYSHFNPQQVTSMINANKSIREIVFLWFYKLFNKELIKEANHYVVRENGTKYTLNLDGDGYKTFFNLIYYLCSPEYKFLVFEEPEKYLHPNLQISLFNMIKKLAKDYEKRVFLVTHNSYFIDLLSENVEVFLLNKNKKTIYNLTDLMNQITNNQFKTWIHYNKHILFSKEIVLLEGHSDQIILNHLLSKLNHTAFAKNHDTEGTWYPPNRVNKAHRYRFGKLEKDEEVMEVSCPG